MVEKAELKISLEVKNTVTREITGFDTVQCPREPESESNGDDKQPTGHENPTMTTQSQSNASPAENVKVDVITRSSQGENTHSQVESKRIAPQTDSNLPVTANGKSSSSADKVIPLQVNTSSVAANALATAIGTPLESPTQSRKQQTMSGSDVHDHGRDQNQSKSQPPPTNKGATNPVQNLQPAIEMEKASLPLAKTLEGAVSNGVVSQNSKVAPPNQPKAPATIINAGQVPAMTSKIPPKVPLPNAISDHDPTTAVEDVVQRLRAPLVNTYGSFIHPTDTSLADARKRLQTALEQTRVLRAAFTDRVYEKYRVLLRPVPKSIDQIVGKIKADPVAANLSILEDIRILKEEKETEKKEAQLTAAASLGPGDSAAASAALTASSIETAEQLSYISAGLNLVILPEDEISEHDLGLLRFEHRGPTNPETGQRVPGISAAAATAAEVLLDRVRRAGSLRTDRQKRRQINSLPGEMPAGAPVEPPVVNPILSRIHLMSSGTTSSPTPMTVHTAPIDLPVASLKAPKKIYTGKPNPAFLSPTMTGKSGRSRAQPPTSAANLLTLNPAAEEIQFDEVNMASTKALIAHGVGNTYQSRSPQNRHRHPHPSSLGGRSAGTQSGGKFATIGSDPLGYTTVDLPTLLVGKERRFKKAVKTADRSVVSKDRVLTCLNSILVQFASVDETRFDVHTKGKTESVATKKGPALNIVNPTIGDSICETPSFTQRRTTEIGLLRGMQHSSEGGNRSTDGSFLSVHPFEGALGISTPPAAKRATEVAEEDHQVEPVLAFSVLHALGLVRDTPTSRYEQCQSRAIKSRIEFSIAGKANDGSWPGGSAKLKALCQRITRKKRRFTEVFFAAARKAEENPPAKRLKKSAPIPQPEPSLTDNCEGEMVKSVSVTQGTTVAVEAQALVGTDLQASKADPRGSGDVLSIRGGGGEDVTDLDDNDDDRLGRTTSGKKRRLEPKEVDATEKPNVEDQIETGPKNSTNIPSGDNSSSSVQRNSSLPPSYDAIIDMESRPPNQSASTVISKFSGSATFSPPRNNTALIAAARQHQAALAQRTVNQAIAATQERFHHSTGALHLQGSLQHASLNMIHGHHGNMSDFFGGLHAPAQRGPYGSLTDWSQLDAANAAVGLLPTHSSLAMGLHQQHAAMVNLSVDRARALLAREHQNAAVAVAQRQAAVRATGGVAGLSPQQAAILMGQSGGAALFQSTSTRFSHVGTHSAAAILSSPAAVMMNQGSSLGTQLQAMQRAAGSRPGSSSSVMSGRGTSRPSSAKGRTKVSKEDKPTEDTAIGKPADSILGVDESSKKKRKTTERPQSSSSAGRNEKMDQYKSTSKIPPETNNDATETKKIECEHETKLLAQTSVSDQQIEIPVVAPAAIVLVKEDVPVETIASTAVRTVPHDAPSQPHEVPDHPETADHSKSSESLPPVAVLTAGMQFFAPNAPDLVTPEMATDVLEARVHNAAKRATDRNFRALLEFVQSVGSAVPIPKALVSHLLRERLASPGFKVVSGINSPSIPREVVAATVLIWLWVQHKESFQRAFAKSGRIDVDPECKWLIQAAVDAAIRALAAELSLAAPKAQAAVTAEGKGKGAQDSVAKGDLQVASTVSKALMTEMCIDEDIDETLPVFDDLVDLLDEARMCALRSKCSERSLLATLVARSVTMSEAFSHAYVSSMVRAGEALGHGELFELAQDEKTCTSTMIPYDIFSDEHGAWEDPCRLPNGFMPGLTGEDLMRRAHARAMIQKSLKKMQDRNNIRGGALNSGPYAEPAPSQSPAGSASNIGLGRGLQRTPSGSLKKKSSFTFSGDATNPGSGSAPAKSMTQYNPTHTSIPLFWDGDVVENTPYGKFVKGPRPRAFSMTKFPMIRGGRGGKRGRGSAHAAAIQTLPTSATAEDIADSEGAAVRSTEEVEWVDVAEIFETVNLEGTPSVKKSRKLGHHRPSPHGSRKIIAPFCRRLEVPLPQDDDEESDLDEDLRDEHILVRHREVLDAMKEKLDKVMENRPLTAQQRARNRAEARRNASIEGAS